MARVTENRRGGFEAPGGGFGDTGGGLGEPGGELEDTVGGLEDPGGKSLLSISIHIELFYKFLQQFFLNIVSTLQTYIESLNIR